MRCIYKMCLTQHLFLYMSVNKALYEVQIISLLFIVNLLKSDCFSVFCSYSVISTTYKRNQQNYYNYIIIIIIIMEEEATRWITTRSSCVMWCNTLRYVIDHSLSFSWPCSGCIPLPPVASPPVLFSVTQKIIQSCMIWHLPTKWWPGPLRLQPYDAMTRVLPMLNPLV